MPKAAEPVKPSPKAPARMSKKDPLTREQVKTIDACPPASSICWTIPCCGSR